MWIAIGIVVLVYLFAYSLCRASARADEAMGAKGPGEEGDAP
jgi:hypothetical protein